jgi:hypothetical protein
MLPVKMTTSPPLSKFYHILRVSLMVKCLSCGQVHSDGAMHPLQYVTLAAQRDKTLSLIRYCSDTHTRDNKQVRQRLLAVRVVMGV